MEKTASKRWRESGSTLTFKEWINRENQKGQASSESFIPFDGGFAHADGITLDTSAVNATISDSIKQAQADINTVSGLKTTASNTTLGIDNNVLLFSTVLIAASLVWYFHSRAKKS